ncbi:hypothetical protein CQW23_21839 [Capsicum baccatum]|uniref:Alcohol dehydrogenase-like C-terminal domain-containing protein n=1 Tax=Capsicum baccatum TaxID=33114 RepID=A0A2G2VZ54_CAPBA|nr:hypothetical protein CQW23_21839 [Capsicum baccatum]
MFFNPKIFFLLEEKSPGTDVVGEAVDIGSSAVKLKTGDNVVALLNPLMEVDNVLVLVIAASGGVGHYAVQLAKLGNAHVTGTCRARNVEFTKNLGADEVLDYKTSEGAKLKSPLG